eukprot:TRINITY_DN3204_c0_g1_i12.p1 TRINITY_DN3204_c0_g1~~TRINITY_DN3204_c0_g1_i12.p1  ORF type:complete len:196 (-),score=-18.40 TRINITY_DN3204_c0_g1_i12:65-652(-)
MVIYLRQNIQTCSHSQLKANKTNKTKIINSKKCNLPNEIQFQLKDIIYHLSYNLYKNKQLFKLVYIYSTQKNTKKKRILYNFNKSQTTQKYKKKLTSLKLVKIKSTQYSQHKRYTLQNNIDNKTTLLYQHVVKQNSYLQVHKWVYNYTYSNCPTHKNYTNYGNSNTQVFRVKMGKLNFLSKIQLNSKQIKANFIT